MKLIVGCAEGVGDPPVRLRYYWAIQLPKRGGGLLAATGTNPEIPSV